MASSTRSHGEERKGHHPCPRTTGCHGSDGGPGVGLRGIHLRGVEVGLAVMAAHCKEISTQRREAHPPSAHVHGGYKLPHVGLGVVSVGDGWWGWEMGGGGG